MATAKLASCAASLLYSHLPPEATPAAIPCFYNWAGCTVGGSQHTATTIAYASLSLFFCNPTSSLLGHQCKSMTDAQHAALFNGISCAVHVYDGTPLETI